MMQAQDKVIEILKNAERSLLEVLAEAALEADYDEIDRAREAASGLLKMLHRYSQRQSNGLSRNQTRTSTSVQGDATQRRNYPLYSVVGSDLIKTGWSKKNRTTYEHRLREERFLIVISVLQRFAADGRVTVRGEIITEQTTLAGVPEYQTYTVLGFLRESKVVEYANNEGFVFDQNVERKAKELWNHQSSLQKETELS